MGVNLESRSNLSDGRITSNSLELIIDVKATD